MKKLSLKMLNFGTNELLQREQLKTVFGGYDSCMCSHGCQVVGASCTINGKSGTCHVGTCDGCNTRMCYTT